MRLRITADGGSRGNPGPAGYGAAVSDLDTGEVLAERAAGIGRATNNVAEYGGLIAGLTAAAALAAGGGVTDVLVEMDSKLVVEQMSGRWKVKHPDMIPLAREAAALVRKLPPTSFRWIPRERNKHADRLANEAMDAQAQGRAWEGETAAALPLAGETGTPAGSAARGEASLPGQPTLDAPPPADSPVAAAEAAPAAAAYASPAAGGQNSLRGWSAPSGAPLTTVLLRHGQTPLSVSKAFSGRGNPELTETGRAQAADAAARLQRMFGDTPPAVLLTSPLSRARQTAELAGAALGVKVQVEERLAETDFGDWEGWTFAEVRERWPDELDAWLGSPDVAPPGGESFTETVARVRSVLEDWRAAYSGSTVLAVSHVTPIKSFARLALEADPGVLYRLHLDLCSVSTMDWYEDGPATLRGWNALT